MNKLNITNWKQFLLGDKKYFQIKRIKKPVILSNYNLSLIKERGKFPLISSSSENNGTVGWIYSNEEILHKRNAITIAQDGSIFSSFFQLSDFYTRINMLIFRLKTRELNHFLAFFLCSIISLEKPKYSYGRTLKEEDVLKTKIPLPVDEKGEPNWLWMENYSIKIFNKVKEDIIKLIYIERERERERAKISLDNWNELQISDYFHTSSTKTTKKEDISPGEFAYITTKNTFNGWESSSHIWTERGNVISVDSATNGACFYQEKDFVASDHVEKIWPKNKVLNQYNALFLTTILNFESHKYSYGRKRNLENIKKEKVFLPHKQSDFNWEYMENIIEQKWEEIATKFKRELEKY